MSAEFVVDLDAMARNLQTIRETIAPAEHMLVVKDDAYAHGIDAVLTRAWAEGIRWIGALDVTTGVHARDVLGPDARIFAWMIQGPADVADAVDADLDCGIGSLALLHEAAAGAGDQPLRVHLKIDTGLHRNGVRPEEWAEFAAQARAYELENRIRVDGIWTHIAEASDAEDDRARAEFDRAVEQAREVGLTPEKLHMAASAAAFVRPEFRYDMVRIGAFAYGIRSTDGPSDAELGIEPIGTLTAPVLGVDEESQTMTVGVGFAGLSTIYAGHLTAQLAGSATHLREVKTEASVFTATQPPAQPGDRLALFGGSAFESATDIAERIGTIGEEIVLRVSPLIERRYLP